MALASGKSANEIVEFYEKHIPIIFQKKFFSCLYAWFYPSFEQEKLLNSARELFGDKTLENVITDVCITMVSLNEAKPRFYKSDYFKRNITRLDKKLSDIATATSSAPTFFKAYSTKYSQNLIDGGICANNPSIVALTDAIQILKKNPNNNNEKKRIITFKDSYVIHRYW